MLALEGFNIAHDILDTNPIHENSLTLRHAKQMVDAILPFDGNNGTDRLLMIKLLRVTYMRGYQNAIKSTYATKG